jgi:predicted P-loop ATPase
MNNNSANGQNTSLGLLRVSKASPCLHCGKPDWCYSIGELSVCNREQPPATGWEATSKADKDGKIYYAPIQQKKAIRPRQTRYWEYRARDGSPLVRVVRFDDGEGGKPKWSQQSWGKCKRTKQMGWIGGTEGIAREDIPIYRYAEIQQSIANNELIYLVEGEACADIFWKLGLAATCNIGGSGKWRSSDTSDLQGAKVVIVPDRDEPGIKHAEVLHQEFSDALWLYPYPDSKAWENLPKSKGLDIADWVEQYQLTSNEIKAAVTTERKVFEKPADQELAPKKLPKSKIKSKIKRFGNLIADHWGGRLRLNEMSQQIELDGKAGELDIERVYIRVADELDVDIPKQIASDLVVVNAKKNAYSPVKDYLNSVAGVAPVNLDDLALRYFGTDNPLHAVLLKRTLIAAVARVFKPGCKVDTLCILQGGQGTLKSTFWQTLVGETWFTDNLNDANEKDEKLKLRRYWMLEFSEFETAYKRKEVEQLKAFLSSRVDSLRKPYGKAIEDFPRTSVFVGSTNRQEFLHDPTGERRYWVIPVAQKIPIHIVEQERDQIWSAAVAAYKAGEQWWLTPDEDALLAQANQGWQSSDAWESDVMSYVENLTTCTISELLTKAIQMELAHQGKADQMRVSDILRRNGWAKSPTQRRIGGKPQWFWERVVTGSDGVVTEVVTPSNPVNVRVIDEVSPPVTTFSPNLSENDGEVVESPAPKKSKSFENKVVTPPPQNSGSCPQQGLEGVTTSPSPPLRTFAIGDRVVVKDVGGIYQGTRGQIVDTWYSRAGSTYLVKFDKPVRNVQQLEVKPSDLMKL